ncbi:uncharacterized protein BXIN_0774 [Babesia sp. Xinjiang]|uniref:uncharacterized protein n=1 Tax=Babesia sp. Xinjiang TaxID=462227 RepID=UPI000A24F546|nr:uncharacterized protein BXIN_0774 [Babesia sp. Xinjiang]ORM41335.1 hypothetical protein BXIN_0774 [Babesia sp. Xinjiang]
MSGGLGSNIFSRLLSVWKSLRGDTMKFVDAVTHNTLSSESTEGADEVKFNINSRTESFSTTDGSDGSGAPDEIAVAPSVISSPRTVDNENEFIVTLKQDQESAEESKENLNAACASYRTDVPLDELLQVSVGLHNNLERRVEQICETLAEKGVSIEAPKTELPETIPEAVHEGFAKEKALTLKRGRCRRSQRNLYPTPKLEETRPSKLSKKSDPTDLKQLDLSKETRQLLQLDSPRNKRKTS